MTAAGGVKWGWTAAVTNAGDADSRAVPYRPDIDGLRAVAVLSVVLSHLWQRAFPGGVLGVDIFFVVSGYLITAIVWREARSGAFTALGFYDRRMRRILPALFVLLAATTLAAAALLLPGDLIGYAKSQLASLGFSANIFFWRDTNYFAPAALQKPLLHLWSLGIEEQFYLLCPVPLAWLARRRPGTALPAVAVLSLASLALEIFARLAGGEAPAFYLLPTRAWELGLGAAVALLPFKPARPALWSTLGAVLVVAAAWRPLGAHGLVPAALPADLGTAAIILSGPSPAVNRMLRAEPLRLIGLASYSLYLWHWPIIVFARYYGIEPIGAAETAGLVLLMALCAAASWYFVERPFRSRRIGAATVRGAALAGAAILASVSALLIWSDGLPSRLSGEAAQLNAAVGSNYRCPVQDYLRLGLSRACAMNLPSRDPGEAQIVLLGDSHAQMYAPVWTAILKEAKQPGLLVPLDGCLPTTLANNRPACLGQAQRNLTAVLKLPKAHVAVLALSWWHHTVLFAADGRAADNRDNGVLLAALDALIGELHRAGKRVILIGPIAEPGWPVASVMSRVLAFGGSGERPLFQPRAGFQRQFAAVFAHFQDRRDIVFVRPDAVQCQGERCAYIIGGHALFADSTHLAAAELRRFHAAFQTALRTALAR